MIMRKCKKQPEKKDTLGSVKQILTIEFALETTQPKGQWRNLFKELKENKNVSLEFYTSRHIFQK